MIKIINHSKKAISIAVKFGWAVGARYTNLRDVKTFEEVTFIDIDWKNYNFQQHLNVVKQVKPFITCARDIDELEELSVTLNQARMLLKYSKNVIIVPKDPRFKACMHLIPEEFILGYSVPSKYGQTCLTTKDFGTRKVHLLGGRPDKQRLLAEDLNVVSIDCNRFTLDARYGDYFNGEKFVKHPIGGYTQCLTDSIININKIWEDYYGN